MIVIKGNLTITRQAQISNSSETSSDKNNIVAYANLSDYDIKDATIFTGDIHVEQLNGSQVLVTGEVIQEN